ncbi:putative membrane protein [Runella defluvii]|uniref:Putative membrane protein n=1 Tax=Runella defluvii TaxID=370973 RepID=A0A7W5ZPA4_9BACT|nr:FN3 associated domain-containing protein [Runella defluvii]MBB3839209.1 putative membrane protein [Runella defluvii]
MFRFQTLLSYLLVGLHVLLLFLLIFQEKVMLPAWLQPVGRMHPMLLHLPIGLLVIVGLLWLFKREFVGESFTKLMKFILGITALSAAAAALMGFFLSREEGYTADVLNWHKYTGIGLSFLCYGLWALYQTAEEQRLFTPLLGLSAVAMFVTGHFGASLTHGEGYLFPTTDAASQLTFTDDTPVFEAAIQPILKAKCYQCHNEQKTKGELLMTTLAGLLKGGKNGPIWVAGDALKSHLIQRANLPLEDKNHMPPKGKAQLAADEIGVLTAWINAGANTKQKVGQLAANDPIRAFLNKEKSAETQVATYDFEPASEETIEKLNTPFRVIFPIANGSPALHTDFFVRQAYKQEQLGELSEIKDQLVALNLSNMPVKNEDLKTIGQFEQLEKLVLNNTDITDATLSNLQSLTKLKSLSLSGTKQTKAGMAALAKLPVLKEVFIWNTPISEAEAKELQKQYPAIRFEMGYVPTDAEKLKLNPPVLVNENLVLTNATPVSFKHPLKGVTIRYTTDGTLPDSLTAPAYQKPFALNGYTIVKARAVKDKWYASDIVEYTFFKGGYRPKTVELLNEPNPQYMGEGGGTLVNFKKGEANDFKNKAWLGYREKPLEALFVFDKPTPVKSVMLSIGRNLGGYIFPPASIEVWAGNDRTKLELMQKLNPVQPTQNEAARIEAIETKVKEGSYTFIKVIARPVAKLPEWHGGKGQPAWVFVDEVFFN